MKKSARGNKKRKRRNFWIYLLVLIIGFAASAAASFLFLKDRFAFESTFLAEIEERGARFREMQNVRSERLYGKSGTDLPGGGSIVLRKDALLVKAEDVISRYMEQFSVRILDLYLDKRGVIYVDFGGELRNNFRGNASEELQLLAGLYKSVTAAIPEVEALKILIESKEAESLGGHIDISRPLRADIAESI